MKPDSPAIWCIPGLGFDHRIFAQLDLDPFVLQPLSWLEPHKKESIQAYSRRMAQPISNRAGPNIVIGHSFGGIIAQEISQSMPIDLIILISSIKSSAENPWFFRAIAPLHLQALFRKQWVIPTVALWGKRQGYDTSQIQGLFKNMVAGHSNAYLQWALRELSRWRGLSNPQTPLFQFHGSRDRTFPLRRIHAPDQVVPGGTHFMVYKRAAAISATIRSIMRTHFKHS